MSDEHKPRLDWPSIPTSKDYDQDDYDIEEADVHHIYDGKPIEHKGHLSLCFWDNPQDKDKPTPYKTIDDDQNQLKAKKKRKKKKGED